MLSRTEIEESATVKWARDPESAIFIADWHSIYDLRKRFFVIGGEEIFDLFERYINKVWLTEVFTGRINGDAKFEMEFLTGEWRTLSEVDYPQAEKDEFPFRISVLVRRYPVHRTRLKSEFLKHDADISDWLERYEEMWAEASDDDEDEPVPSTNVEQLALDLSEALGNHQHIANKRRSA